MSASDRPTTFHFGGQVALVTGSGRGLGRMIAETLLKGGAHVALHDIGEDAPAAHHHRLALERAARARHGQQPARLDHKVGGFSHIASGP